MVIVQLWSLPIDSPHPAAHGGITVELATQDAVVQSAEIRPGNMHRGAEKLFESRDYRAALALADRHDWLGSFCSELGLAQLLEQQLGIRVSSRAAWLRLMMAEATRVVHHLTWLAATAAEVGIDHLAVDEARVTMQSALERYSGSRMHPMIVRIGGMQHDCPEQWPETVTEAGMAAKRCAGELTSAIEEAIPRGLATLPTSAAVRFSTSGPMARASAVGRDLRVDAPDAVYEQLLTTGALRSLVEIDGDARARFVQLIRQVQMSADCLDVAVGRLSEAAGPIHVSLPKSIRVPEGHGYWATENPAGVNGWYLVSNAGAMPWRLKLRTASFNNAQAASVALAGVQMAELRLAMMSLLLTAGDLDK